MARTFLALLVVMSFAFMAASRSAAAEATAEPGAEPKAERTAEPTAKPDDRVFGTTKVVKFHLAMTEKQFAALAPAGGGRMGPPGFGGGFGGGFGTPRPPADNTHRNTFGVDFPWSQGDLTFADAKSGDAKFTGVGVRYKGNYTYMATARSLKKSLKIDFNRNVKGQSLDGLTMLNFHCGVSDPTSSRESFSYAYFRQAGVPAPRTAFAELRLTVPGKYDNEYVGVYTLVEQVNETFLARHYGDGGGMLLKPEGLQGGPAYLGKKWRAYGDQYDPEEKPSDDQKQRLIDFTDLISNGSDEAFAAKIGEYLDIDTFLRFIAANALLSNLDSYLGFGHNYYLYLVPATNKFVFIPWDLDLSLATWPAVGTPEQLVELSIHHPHAGDNRLLDRLFAIPAHKQRYLAIIKELVATSFSSEKLLALLEPIEKTVEGPLAQEKKAVAARNEGRGGGFGGFGGFGGGPGGAGPGGAGGPGGGPAGGPGGGGPGGGGQFGQSMPPRRFIEKRTASVAAQLAGQSNGFEPKPFGFGFGPGGGGPGAGPGAGPGPGRGPGAGGPGAGGRAPGPGGRAPKNSPPNGGTPNGSR